MSDIIGESGAQAIYRSSPISLSDKQPASLGLDKNGNLRVSTNAATSANATPVAVSGSPTVVKNSAGFLSGVLVTAAGTNQSITFYDNASAASGTIIGIVPSGATVGQYFPFNMPAVNGITASGNANNPAVTVAYS